jgi:glycosyltransferase involved in cell wall biosynthesis
MVLRRNDFTIDGRVERQAETLGEMGMRVCVLAMGGGALPRAERRPGYDLIRLPIDPVLGVGEDVLRGISALPRIGGATRRGATLLGTGYYYGEAVRRVVASRPRVVHCHDLDTLLPGVVGATAVGARVVYDSAELWTERNSGYRGVRRRLDRARYALLERSLIRHAHAVITVSDGIADELARRYGIATPVVLRNVPRDPGQLGPSPLRERVGGTGPILLHLGIVDMNRGLEEATRALAELPDVRLVLLGTARPYVLEPLLRLAEELGVRSRVIHLPPVPREEILRWAAGADAALCTFRPVCTSHVLAMPNKLFEYAFSGVPIVASDLPDMGRFVRTHGLGVLCNPDSPADIARAVRQVLGGDLPRVSPEAHRAFVREHAWERESLKLAAIYRSLS